MEYQKITNLLGTTLDEVSRFITKKWVEVHDHSGNAEKRYQPSKQIRFKTSMPRSDLYDFSDAYIVEGKVVANFNKRKNDYAGDFPDDPFPDKIFSEGSTPAQITAARNAARTNAVDAANAAGDRRNLIKSISYRTNAPFIYCTSKLNGALIDNAEDLDVTMPMYNFLEYSKNYSKTTGSLWNYYRDEPTSSGEINYYLGSKPFDVNQALWENWEILVMTIKQVKMKLVSPYL